MNLDNLVVVPNCINCESESANKFAKFLYRTCLKY